MINFYGRADGLGNRFGQIIYLEALCIRHSIECKYFWNNCSPKNRTYDVHIKSDRVKIAESKISSHVRRLQAQRVCSSTAPQLAAALSHIPAKDWSWDSFSQEEFLAAAQK